MDADLTVAWWATLSAAATFNVAAWAWSARLLARHRADYAPEAYARRRLLLALAAVYVAGCAFRSFLPMIDVPRLCLADTPLSRIAVGRSVATVAELAFVAQWAILLGEAGARRVALAVLAMIALAEALSWTAVLIANNVFHAAENSLWTLAAVAAVAGTAQYWRRAGERGKRFIAAALACGAGYVVFMVTVDVPMYLARWTPGAPTTPLAQGWAELLARCTVDRDWTLWREDAPWLTLYFTVAVWISVLLPHAPPLGAGASGARPPVSARLRRRAA